MRRLNLPARILYVILGKSFRPMKPKYLLGRRDAKVISDFFFDLYIFAVKKFLEALVFSGKL